MRRRGIVCGLALMVLSLFGCQQAGRIDCDVNIERSHWPLKSLTGSKIETDHYRIYTTVNDERFQDIAATLAEGQFQRFAAMIPRAVPDKMTVYIFSNTRQWMAFTRAKFPPAVARLYLKIRNGGYAAKEFAAFYYMGRYPTLTIMAHEIFHLYLNEIRGDEPVPAWLNEGLACYFEAHEWDDFEPVFTPTKNLFRRQNLSEAVAGNRLFSLKELLGVNAGHVCATDQSRMLTYYAQLWGLMQFLQDRQSGYYERFCAMVSQLGMHEMTLRIKGYLTTCSASENVSFGEAMFRVYITEDLTGFEAQLNAYLRKLVDL